MKRCPQCSTEYDDQVSFCPKDGKSLVAKGGVRTKLCPHCANSIAEDALKCPYCKADLSAPAAPQWPTREVDSLETRRGSQKGKASIASKAILIAGLIVFAIGVFLIGGQRQRSELQSLLEEKVTQLKDKDQMIQSLQAERVQLKEKEQKIQSLQAELVQLKHKEQKLQNLETELAKARKELARQSTQVGQLNAKLEQSQKNLALTQQKLERTAKEAERLAAASKAASAAQAAPRPAEPASRARDASSATDLGVYQTIRPTSVYQEPSPSSRVLSRISTGTRVNVVRSLGDWLEVRSQRDNPPGFVRRDDVTFVAKAN